MIVEDIWMNTMAGADDVADPMETTGMTETCGLTGWSEEEEANAILSHDSGSTEWRGIYS